MPDFDTYLDEIDTARSRRAKELSEIKFRFASHSGPDPSNINSQSVIVLTYASWEGFYNECVVSYVRFLKEKGGKVRESDWMLLLAVFKRDLDSLWDRNHADDARYDFIKNLKGRLECGYEEISHGVLAAHSNLNYARLSLNYNIMSFDLTTMQPFRIRLDKELVTWRHEVAHGNPPDLSALDISGHVDFAATLLIAMADTFQNAMLQRL
jgi:hypothetical protein